MSGGGWPVEGGGGGRRMECVGCRVAGGGWPVAGGGRRPVAQLAGRRRLPRATPVITGANRADGNLIRAARGTTGDAPADAAPLRWTPGVSGWRVSQPDVGHDNTERRTADNRRTIPVFPSYYCTIILFSNLTLLVADSWPKSVWSKYCDQVRGGQNLSQPCL